MPTRSLSQPSLSVSMSFSTYFAVVNCMCSLFESEIVYKGFVKLISGLFWRIHQMDPYSSGIMFVVMTLISTWLVAFAYKNVKFQLKHK